MRTKLRSGREEAMTDVDLLFELNRRVTESLFTGLSQLASGLAQPAARRPTMGERKMRGLERCGCGCDCERDLCHCQCCIGDADLVIYARAGERRVVTIVLENSRRREKDVRVELSNFSTRGGKQSAVTGQLQSPAEFQLPACSERQITIVVNAGIQESDTGERVPDVDECEVAYADLRVEGCDLRPVRIAVAVLPRDCDAYEIECHCSCC